MDINFQVFNELNPVNLEGFFWHSDEQQISMSNYLCCSVLSASSLVTLG